METNYLELTYHEAIMLETSVEKDKNAMRNYTLGLQIGIIGDSLYVCTTDGKKACRIIKPTVGFTKEFLSAVLSKVVELPRTKISKNKIFRLYADKWEILFLKGRSEQVDRTINEEVKFIELSSSIHVGVDGVFQSCKEKINKSEKVYRIRFNTALLPEKKHITFEIPVENFNESGHLDTTLKVSHIRCDTHSGDINCEYMLMPMRLTDKEIEEIQKIEEIQNLEKIDSQNQD